MSISLSSARRLAVSAGGASAVAGAMLFGATPAANAAPAPAPQMVGLAHVAPAAWHPQPAYGGRGFGRGPGGFGRGYGGFGCGYGHRGYDRGYDRGFWGHRGWW
ncbi:MAG: hypothetical protein QOD88_4313 [Mycobacterium sp.]|nr:hypothetical protein [Mycobacterium sp.]